MTMVHPAPVLWLMGLSGAGKTTVGSMVATYIRSNFTPACYYLDSDDLRKIVTAKCSLARDGRMQNVRSGAALAKELSDQGITVVATFMTPYTDMHAMLREELGDRLSLIYVRASVDVCVHRDPKGLYARGMQGELSSPMVGMSDEPDAVFDAPEKPDLILDTEVCSPVESQKFLLDHWCARAGYYG